MKIGLLWTKWQLISSKNKAFLAEGWIYNRLKGCLH